MLIVLPSYRPGACGVSDHSAVLAAAIRSVGKEVKIVEFGVAMPEIRDTARGEVVFLPVVLYGYHRYGMITRLLSLAKQARSRGLRVVTYFHEFPASLLPLRRVSVLIPAQAILCRSLAAHSDAVFVNQARALHRLRDASGRTPVYVPTSSGVGEADVVLAVQFRPNRIAVFGLPGKRERIYVRLQEAGGPKALFGTDSEIVDIGAPCATAFPEAWSVHALGLVDSASVGNALVEAKFGLFAAPSGETAKSSTFAAYCAYGVIPVNVEPQRTRGLPQDPRLGREFTDLSRLSTNMETLQHLQSGARAWREKYSVLNSTAMVLRGLGLSR